jgi:hypothetical protein
MRLVCRLGLPRVLSIIVLADPRRLARADASCWDELDELLGQYPDPYKSELVASWAQIRFVRTTKDEITQ